MTGINILGTGMYLPPLVATNKDFEKLVETSDEWITTRTGIKQRHLSDGIPTWLMGARAASDAVENAGISASDIDMIITTSVTSDFFTPSISCLIQGNIGAVNASCMDLNAACAGFVYALDTAVHFLMADSVKRVLIVSTEMLSKMVDYTDRSTCVLFGDGAAACVVSKGEGIYAGYLAARGADAGKIFARSTPKSNPFASHEDSRQYDNFAEYAEGLMYMDGKEVYKFATKAMPEAVREACRRAGIEPSEIDIIVPHQANIRIVETAASNLSMPIEKFYINVQDYGNTSSASIPICLNELNRANKLKSGMKICLVGFGGGLVYAACVIEI